jgi:mycothiol synthase
MDATVCLRPVVSDADLEGWVHVKNAVVPNEPVTVAQMRAEPAEGRLLLLAELDGLLAGAGMARRSHFVGRGFVAARVLPEFRRRGVGSALLLELADYVGSLGCDELASFVSADEPHSLAFAEHFGMHVVDYELEQTRMVGVEEPPVPTAGVELRSLEGCREELLRAAWPIAEQAYEDMPLPGTIVVPRDEWLREEATLPAGSFVALLDGEIVGYAGLLQHADGPTVAEHGLTTVRRDVRRHGIASTLKRAQIAWAADHGVEKLLTWTQRGNEPMQSVNRRLGYVDGARALRIVGPLPTPAS